jgi:hypothetical protein
MPAHPIGFAVTLLVVSVSACRSGQPAIEPAPVPATAGGVAATPPESSQVVATYDQIIRQVEAGEESFMKMSIAAAGWLGHLVPGKSIGFYQPDLAAPEFKDMVEEVTRRYAFRAVRTADFRYTCDRTGNCSMAMADVIAQFNTTRQSIDSGYVGGSITQVPRGGSSPEQKAFCITLVRQGADWKPIRSAWSPSGRQCPVTKPRELGTLCGRFGP